MGKGLEKFGMSNCKPIETPIDQNYNFEILKKEKSESGTIERKCCCFRNTPRFVYSVIFRYQHCASTALYKALQRILRRRRSKINFWIYFNNIWLYNILTLKKTTNCLLIFFWSAVYIPKLCNNIDIKKLLLDFKLDSEKSIFEDNQSVIKLTKNNENNKRLKYVDIKYHYTYYI